MSILKTELKKDERARDLKAMGHATFFLSSIDDSALIDPSVGCLACCTRKASARDVS
jgi:hypothetical protein